MELAVPKPTCHQTAVPKSPFPAPIQLQQSPKFIPRLLLCQSDREPPRAGRGGLRGAVPRVRRGLPAAVRLLGRVLPRRQQPPRVQVRPRRAAGFGGQGDGCPRVVTPRAPQMHARRPHTLPRHSHTALRTPRSRCDGRGDGGQGTVAVARAWWWFSVLTPTLPALSLRLKRRSSSSTSPPPKKKKKKKSGHRRSR